MFAECSLYLLVNLLEAPEEDWGKSDLTVLALPDEIGFASATAHFVLLEAAYGNEVGVRLAT